MNSPPLTEGKLRTCIKCKEEFPVDLDSKILEIVDGSLLCSACKRTNDDFGHQLGIPSVCGALDKATNCETDSKVVYVCNVCCKAYSVVADLCAHLRPLVDESLCICKACNKTFATRFELRRHSATHTGERPHVCRICEKAFTSSSYLRVHQRLHTGERPYSCGECGAAFAQQSGLAAHAPSHTGVKPHRCGVCPASFSRAAHLRLHDRVHTGEKPHACDVCGKAFSQKGSLRQHTRLHTGEKPFACGVCGKAYSRNFYLKNHMRSHPGEKPHVCDLCEAAFAQRFQLLAHACAAHRSGRSTTFYVKAPTLTVRKRAAKKSSASVQSPEQSGAGGKPYLCGECKEAFPTARDLMRHQRTHRAKKFFECNLCLKTFMKRMSLKLHRWRCHELMEIN